jgi:hypothetical protein
MRKPAKAKEKELQELEEEFPPLLHSCLRECARGRWGLFGQNDHPEMNLWYYWPEAVRLREIAIRIQLIRTTYGVPNELCERFLALCSLRGSNALGEPRLAESFLHQLNVDANS